MALTDMLVLTGAAAMLVIFAAILAWGERKDFEQPCPLTDKKIRLQQIRTSRSAKLRFSQNPPYKSKK